MHATLATLGWDDFFSKQVEAQGAPDLVPGRVVAEHRGRYRVWCEGGECEGALSGRLWNEVGGQEFRPVVGDWVLAALRPAEGRATIQRILDRRSAFLRREAGSASRVQALAANIERVFVVSSLNSDLNERRIERYLALAWESGAQPLLLLTKADLCPDVAGASARIARLAPGVPVLAVCAQDGRGLEALGPYLAPGRTAVLLGSSGVGKSTLLNRLAGRQMLATQAIGDDDSGRHTTTYRQLVLLPGGGMLIDTPGMRELGLNAGGEGGLGLLRTFEEVEGLVARCRFSDCRHQSEPGCAVREALEAGALDPARYRGYLKLRREQAWQLDSAGALRQKRDRFKAISRLQKSWKRRNSWSD